MAIFPKLAVEGAPDLPGLGGLTGDELKGVEAAPVGGVLIGVAAVVGATVGEAAGGVEATGVGEATVGEAAGGGEAGDLAGDILGASDGDLAGDVLGAGDGVGAAIEAELNNPTTKTKQRTALNRAILSVSCCPSANSCHGNCMESIPFSSSKMKTTGINARGRGKE
ncbi:hypothetical protein, partial [Acinetobacter indicus]|uniref:hypothetical protein n=1 Tax=Acinetobacter indicus TaxID=756892 RepID=UPI00209132ED